MYSIDSIRTLLNEGKNPEEIAKNFSDALNAAIKQKEAEEKAEENRKRYQIEDAEAIIDAINEFLDDYYPGIMHLSFTGEEFVEAFEELIPELRKFNQILEYLAPEEKPKTKEESATAAVKFNTNDDALTAFLRSFGL